MINRYLAPCRYCGGTVPPDSGTVEKVGQSWQAAHLPCAETHRTGGQKASLMMKTVALGRRVAYP
jgi:hypothetical protein